jgi:hypothetical protein
MSTDPSSLEAALATVPAEFRGRIVDRYRATKSAYVERQFDACGVRAGRLCEVIVRFLQKELTGTFIAFGTKIGNLTDECIRLEKLPASAGHESYRVLIPRALNFAYTLRNKRDFGHEGGDVEANEIDAATAVRVMDWCISEIVRVTQAIPLEDAQALLDAIAERQVPLVWSVPGGPKIVLEPSLTQAQQLLVLLDSETDTAVPIEDLADSIGAKRMDHFKARVIKPLQDRRLIRYDEETSTVILSPKGAAEADAIAARLKKVI